MEMSDVILSTPTESLIPDEFVNSPCEPTKLEQLKAKLGDKYGLETGFLREYLKHASQRNSVEVLTSRFLLPPGYKDKQEMENMTVQCYDLLKKYNTTKLERRMEVLKSMHELKAAISAAEEQKESKRVVQTLKNQLHELVEAHTQYVNKAYAAREDLYKLTFFKPINADEFHRDMHELSLLYVESDLKPKLPGLTW